MARGQLQVAQACQAIALLSFAGSTFRTPDGKNNSLVSECICKSKLSFKQVLLVGCRWLIAHEAGFFPPHSALAVAFLPPTSNASSDYKGNNIGANIISRLHRCFTPNVHALPLRIQPTRNDPIYPNRCTWFHPESLEAMA